MDNPIFDLIIFDCDGTLVDSEAMNCKALSDVLVGYGLAQYTPAYVLEHFTGITVSRIMLIIQMETGFDFPPDTVARYIRRVEELQQIELRPVAGATELVRAASAVRKVCVASNGERANVIRSIELTGLKGFFPDDIIFTKIQVKNAKPAPDLFLFAAASLGVEPARCLVVEDSVAGVTAGAAAGMYTLGFTGTAHEPEKSAALLQQAGANRIIADLIHIQDML